LTREEHVALMALLEAYHPGRIRMQDKAVVEMWYRELQDLPGEAVLAAVRHMARTSDQWPTLAQIRRWAAPVEDTAQLWADTVRLVCEYGPHGRWDSETRTTTQPQLTTEQRVVSTGLVAQGRSLRLTIKSSWTLWPRLFRRPSRNCVILLKRND